MTPEASEIPKTAIAAGNPSPASMAANFLGIRRANETADCGEIECG
jgi:hypothetical protein